MSFDFAFISLMSYSIASIEVANSINSAIMGALCEFENREYELM